ncbi:DUF423 domain-containing protein [Pseudomonas schmalbachii]|uniref:DUF423 domain-containing protein n=1 Tax=Pseudomonas schmalbachii TaxID=2816993 RepID=A0ABS3TWA5_9PSED|nr:DUF423 domain-containing protein [Pseudomonas schmalbachii]MBO3277966.1 DUF423 domain-containing protein [Pseudomonas schmalbachii]
MLRTFLMLAAFFGFTGVALGAFAAHGLKARLSAEYLTVFQTGVHYQQIHALALIGVALLSAHIGGRLVEVAGWLFTAGILLFSGSLYLLTVTGTPMLGMITPIGGVAFLGGWLLLFLVAFKLA